MGRKRVIRFGGDAVLIDLNFLGVLKAHRRNGGQRFFPRAGVLRVYCVLRCIASRTALSSGCVRQSGRTCLSRDANEAREAIAEPLNVNGRVGRYRNIANNDGRGAVHVDAKGVTRA